LDAAGRLVLLAMGLGLRSNASNCRKTSTVKVPDLGRFLTHAFNSDYL
jgi:hypothetical protein